MHLTELQEALTRILDASYYMFHIKMATSMLVKDVGDGCLRRNVLVTTFRCW